MTKRSLHAILSADPDLDGSDAEIDDDDGMQESVSAIGDIATADPNYCCECGDQLAEVWCTQCDEQAGLSNVYSS